MSQTPESCARQGQHEHGQHGARRRQAAVSGMECRVRVQLEEVFQSHLNTPFELIRSCQDLRCQLHYIGSSPLLCSSVSHTPASHIHPFSPNADTQREVDFECTPVNVKIGRWCMKSVVPWRDQQRNTQPVLCASTSLA